MTAPVPLPKLKTAAGERRATHPMIRFEDIYETVKRHHPEADLELLRKAYIFSAVEHKGQTRASGEPYLVHPLEVAAILADMRMDPACVAVGLLHDVLEDTLTDPERLKEYFGPDVLHIVEGVTKISKIPFSTSEERQAENYRKMLLAMVDDVRVILVKLADRLHNMRTLQYLPEERRVRIARETMDIYAPLAGRLGMSKIKNELEDLSFQYLEPESYKDLAARVKERRQQATDFIEKIKATVAEKLRAAGLEATVEGRIKRLYSIHQKLRRQRIDLDQVYDFVALRVVVRTRPRLLRRPRRPPQPLAPGARPHQGLHRHAAAQRLPVAAHLGDRRRGPPLRGADPHPGDAPGGRGGDRRPLEVQGGARPASTRTTRPSPGCASSWSGSRRSRTRTSS